MVAPPMTPPPSLVPLLLPSASLLPWSSSLPPSPNSLLTTGFLLHPFPRHLIIPKSTHPMATLYLLQHPLIFPVLLPTYTLISHQCIGFSLPPSVLLQLPLSFSCIPSTPFSHSLPWTLLASFCLSMIFSWPIPSFSYTVLAPRYLPLLQLLEILILNKVIIKPVKVE